MYPHERSLVEDYEGRPFTLLGVNNDKEISRVKEAVRENDINWRSWYDGSKGPIVKQFGIRSFPTIFLVDHTGVIRYKNVRGKKLDKAIAKLVEEAEGAGMTGGNFREFIDVTGEHRMLGSYDRYEDGTVYLTNEDGDEIPVPWRQLSLEDRQYLAQIRLKESGKKDIASRRIEFEFDEPVKFVDKSGEHEMVGTYIGLYKGDAIIWNEDGRELALDRNIFNDVTKDKIKEITKARKRR